MVVVRRVYLWILTMAMTDSFWMLNHSRVQVKNLRKAPSWISTKFYFRFERMLSKRVGNFVQNSLGCSWKIIDWSYTSQSHETNRPWCGFTAVIKMPFLVVWKTKEWYGKGSFDHGIWNFFEAIIRTILADLWSCSQIWNGCSIELILVHTFAGSLRVLLWLIYVNLYGSSFFEVTSTFGFIGKPQHVVSFTWVRNRN